MNRNPSEITNTVTLRECVQTLDALGDPLHVIDRDLRILSVNRAFRDWLSHLDIDRPMVGRSISEAFPFLPSQVLEEYQQVFESGEILTTSEVTNIGSYEIFTETRKIPIHANGDVVRIVTILRDVTEQRLLENTFENYTEQFRNYRLTSEQRFSSIFNASPVSICVFDRDGILTHANPACANLFGLSSSNYLLGQDLFSAPNVPDEVFERIKRGDTIEYEWVLDIGIVSEERMYDTSKDGVMHIGAIVSPININHHPQGWIVQLQDITQWRLAQQRLKKTHDIALEYLDLMSHDVANYLQSILMCSGLLNNVAKDAGMGHVVSMMDEAIFDCIEMIKQARQSTNDLMDYSEE